MPNLTETENMPPFLSPLIGLAGAAGTTALNQVFARGAEKRSRAWSEMMDERQWNRNLEQWHRQNEYNSPAAQMERFREAGLNPAFMYGKGSAGSGLAGAVPTTDPKKPDFPVPQVANFQDIGNQMVNSRLAQSRAEEVRSQNIERFVRTAGQRISNKFQKLALQSQLDGIKIQNDQRSQDMWFQREENYRRNIANSQSIKESLTKILSMEKSMQRDDAEIKKINALINQINVSAAVDAEELRLRKRNMSFRDSILMRNVGTVIDYLMDPAGREDVATKVNNLLKWAASGKLPGWITDSRWLDGK